MSRLHKKCLVASAGTHLALLSLLLISPAFVSPKREPELPVLTFIPTKLTDEPFFSGGSPGAPPPPAAPRESPPVPAPAPQTPTTEVIQPREPEPSPPETRLTKPIEPERTLAKTNQRPKPTKEHAKKPEPAPKPPAETAAAEKPVKPKHEIKPSFDKVTDKSRELAEAKERERKAAEAKAAQARFQERLNRIGESLAKNLSSSTSIEMPGPGGEAYANYGQVVKSKYQNAWLAPDNVTDDSAVVKTRVIILRDGKVKSATIIKRSEIPALDRSVERALGLDFIAPFPEGAKDTERSFNIDFNLKTKRSTG